MLASKSNTWIVSLIAVALSVVSFGHPIPALPQGAATDADAYMWDLSPLFASDAAWESERLDIEQRVSRIARLRGVMRDVATFSDAMFQTTTLRQDVANLTNYALLKAMLDVDSPEAQARYTTSAMLETAVLAAVSFVDDDIPRLGSTEISEFLAAKPALVRYRARIHAIFAQTEHLPNRNAEAVIAALSDWPSSSGVVWQSVFEHGIAWPALRLSTDQTVTLDRPQYNSLRGSGDGATRREVANQYFRELRTFEDVFGVLLTQRISADLTVARLRKFASGLDAAQCDEGLPHGATAIMIESAHKHLDLLRRYLILRMRALGITHPSYYDLYAAAPTAEHHFSVRETLEITRAAAQPLGKRYQDRMDIELTKPWLHLPPWPEKRDTYGLWGNFIGGKPAFGFMRYQGALLDSSRLAGLVFAMMVKTNIPMDRPSDQREDPAIYGNAILMAGQILYSDYLIQHAESRAARVSYLLADLDHMASTCFDDVLLTEFASKVETAIKAGFTPSGSDLSRLYVQMLRSYYGSESELDIDQVFGVAWISERTSLTVTSRNTFQLQ